MVHSSLAQVNNGQVGYQKHFMKPTAIKINSHRYNNNGMAANVEFKAGHGLVAAGESEIMDDEDMSQ